MIVTQQKVVCVCIPREFRESNADPNVFVTGDSYNQDYLSIPSYPILLQVNDFVISLSTSVYFNLEGVIYFPLLQYSTKYNQYLIWVP